LPVVASEELTNTIKFGDYNCVKINNKSESCDVSQCQEENSTCINWYTGDGKKPQVKKTN
jgi:hypothetical protein